MYSKSWAVSRYDTTSRIFQIDSVTNRWTNKSLDPIKTRPRPSDLASPDGQCYQITFQFIEVRGRVTQAMPAVNIERFMPDRQWQ